MYILKGITSTSLNQRVAIKKRRRIMQIENNIKTDKRPVSIILSKTIKTGIIKSNLIPMFSGLTLSLYTYKISLSEKLPEIFLH